jgi:tRNA nucleotidyltransferase (CCA-adding enzyme)
MHDIGKARTQSKDETGTHFYDHDRVGAQMVKKIMSRLKFSNDEIKFVTTLIREHMFGFWKCENVTKKGYLKLFARLEAAGVSIEDYVMMLYCDNQGNMKNTRKKFGDFIKMNEIHKKYYELKFSKEPFGLKDLELGGKDLLEMGLRPGPRIGQILNDAFDKVQDGELKNERSALMSWAREQMEG